MPVALGLLAALVYGSADFLGGVASRASSAITVAAGVQVVGLLVLLPVLGLTHVAATPSAMWFGAFAGILGAAGLALLYRALAIGTMGVVSPITALIAAVLPVAVGTLRGEQLTILQYLGITFALLAVVLITRTGSPGVRGAYAGVPEAVASGLTLGGVYVCLALAGPHAGLYPLLWARALAVPVLALAAMLHPPMLPQRSDLRTIAAAGVLDVSANIAYLLAAQSGALAIAAVLTSLYPGSTVLLARLVLRERLRAVQVMGVGIALLGVALISA